MSAICPKCGNPAEAGDRFCSNCGTPLTVPEGAERKLATMLFADIVGSTALAAGTDPEQLRSRLAPFFEITRSVVADHGGTVEKFIGDAVMAVFGVPQAHGDDADRAIAAGLALVSHLSAEGLEIRVGVETGEVLAVDSGGDLGVTGDAVNAAARLQSAAGPSEVLVGSRAARASRRIELEGPRPVEAKGFPEPLPAWIAGSVLDDDGSRAETPFLGRDDDLELLRLVYKRALRERVPELVTIAGEAGIGKTRLATELYESLRDTEPAPTVLVGRNPPYGRGIALWALNEILRGAAGAGPDDSVAEVRDALAERLAGLGAEDAESVASGLAAAMGGSADGDAEAQLKTGWRRLIALLALEAPLIIGIDDAHWADDDLLDLVEEAAFRLEDAPVLLLCTSRPELLDRRPTFGRSARNVTQIELRPLADAAINELARSLLDPESVELAEDVARASGGNPFFAEEVACRLVESDGGNGTARPTAVMPETVQAAISARLDLLPAEEKRGVQYAAVLGHAFRAESLAELLDTPAADLLSQLVRRNLLTERVAEGGGRFAFRHQLIRDVAYASLPRGQRALLHERAADSIAGRAGARYPMIAELVAYHRVEASKLEPTPERARAAWQASVDAADIVWRRGASKRAQDLFEQGVELAPGDTERLAGLRAAGHLAIRRFRGDEALRLAREEAAVAESAGEHGAAAAALAQAIEIAGRMGGITGDVPIKELRAMHSRAVELADPGDEETRAQLLLDEAWIAWRSGDPESMAEPAREALEMARQMGRTTMLSSALDAATAGHWATWRYRDAVNVALERWSLLESADDSSTAMEVERSDARHMVIESMLQTGDFREAAEHAASAREADLSRGVVYSAWARGLMPAYYLGQWDLALEMAAKVREAWAAENRPPVTVLAAALATAAAIYEIRGETTRAADWWDFTDGLVPTIEGETQGQGLQMLHAQALLHHGRADEAFERVEANPVWWAWWAGHYVCNRVEAMAAAGVEGYEKARADAAPVAVQSPYLRALLDRADGLHSGDAEPLRRALAAFEELGARYEIARTLWLLGGPERDRARDIYRELRAPMPPES